MLYNIFSLNFLADQHYSKEEEVVVLWRQSFGSAAIKGSLPKTETVIGKEDGSGGEIKDSSPQKLPLMDLEPAFLLQKLLKDSQAFSYTILNQTIIIKTTLNLK